MLRKWEMALEVGCQEEKEQTLIDQETGENMRNKHEVTPTFPRIFQNSTATKAKDRRKSYRRSHTEFIPDNYANSKQGIQRDDISHAVPLLHHQAETLLTWRLQQLLHLQSDQR
jgi:hypothetical protein